MKNEPNLCLVFACSGCGTHSYWTRNTIVPYCLHCRCSRCAAVLSRMDENGVEHVYCPTCIKECDVADPVVN
jgi:hypothetical protein